MLDFFRTKAKWIGWGIISLFVLSLFSGAYFLGTQFLGKKPKNEGPVLAIMGKLPVSRDRYAVVLNQTLARFSQDDLRRIDPEFAELIQFSALSQAVQWTIFHKGAEEQHLKVTSQEYEQSLQLVYRDYDVKGLKELKQMLKKSNYSYSDFKSTIQDDLMVQKFVSQIQDGVKVSSQDVYHAYTKVHPLHVLLKVDDRNKDAEVKAQILGIREKIMKGMSFEAAVAQFSQDEKTSSKKGDLGWISWGKVTPEFEAVMFSEPLNKVSMPLRTPVGYHLVKVLERQINLPVTLNMAKASEAVLREKQSRTVQAYVATFLQKNPLVVVDPMIKAYHAKISGDFSGAIGAYQSQISANPVSPVGHYLLGKLYLQTGQKEQAMKEFQKASLKAQLTKGLDFISLHLVLGKLYAESGDNAKRQEQYRLAITVAGSHVNSLNYLLTQFKQRGEKGFADQVQSVLSKIPVAPAGPTAVKKS